MDSPHLLLLLYWTQQQNTFVSKYIINYTNSLAQYPLLDFSDAQACSDKTCHMSLDRSPQNEVGGWCICSPNSDAVNGVPASKLQSWPDLTAEAVNPAALDPRPLVNTDLDDALAANCRNCDLPAMRYHQYELLIDQKVIE